MVSVKELQEITNAVLFNEDMRRRKLAEEFCESASFQEALTTAAHEGKSRIIFHISSEYQEAAQYIREMLIDAKYGVSNLKYDYNNETYIVIDWELEKDDT